MESPLLPWEVIERIIDHSGDEPQTLYNASLTCRDLRPRALCLLVNDVRLMTRTKIFDFCDFLKAKSHLKPLVHLITLDPTDFALVPLLDLLPNVYGLTFAGVRPFWQRLHESPVTVFNRSSLTCCNHLGTRIQVLHLTDFVFSTFIEFARLLLSFKNIWCLVCSRIIVKAEGDRAHLDVIKRRMCKQLQLLVLGIDFYSDDVEQERNPPVAALLLDLGSVQSTVEILALEVTWQPTWPWRRLSRAINYPRLRILVLRLLYPFPHECIADAITFLKNFHLHALLEDVVVHMESPDVHSITKILFGEDCEGLEQTLLRFRQPLLECSIRDLREGRRLFWTKEFEKRFLALFQRRAFTVTGLSAIPGSGHDAEVQDVSASPDGKWVATASWDSTVILWHSADGAMAHQWVAHSYFPVNSLAFSPDSRYLVSGGGDTMVKVWDLAEGSHEVRLLEGHTDNVTRCAWSPRGNTIASASDDRTVRLWDARTSRQLHMLKHVDGFASGKIQFIAFSPDGCRLVSGSSPDCNVWKVTSGTLHKSVRSRDDNVFSGKGFVAFDPTSTGSTGARLAVVSESRVIKVLDVETGGDLAVLRTVDESYDEQSFVSFSPDGILLVTVSFDDVVKIWDTYTGCELFSFEHETQVSHACFSPCGKYVASASADGTVRLWRTRDRSCVATLSEHEESVCLVAFSADGETLWSGGFGGTVVMRRMRDIILTEERDL